MTFHYTKIIQVLIWLVVACNVVLPFGGVYTTVVTAIAVALLVAHLGEYILFYKTINQLPESKPLAFVLTIFFGILYWCDFPNRKFKG